MDMEMIRNVKQITYIHIYTYTIKYIKKIKLNSDKVVFCISLTENTTKQKIKKFWKLFKVLVYSKNEINT